MAVMTRLTRLFRADVHAVLDRLEEPDILLRQAIREMEDEIAQSTQQLRARELERDQSQARRAAIENLQREIAEQLDLCFSAQNESLARTLLRRRLEGERLTRHLDQRLASLQKLIAERAARLDEQRRLLESLRQRAEIFDAEPASPGSDPLRGGPDDFAISDADVELALLRERQQRSAS